MRLSTAVVVLVTLSAFAGATVRAGEAENKLLLSQAVEEALKNNPEIHAFKSKLQSVRARAGQSTYLEDPEVNLEAWAVPLNQPTRIRSANPIVLGVRQKVPFFGKRGLKGEIAQSEVRMAEEELRAKEIEVIAKVKNAYAEYFMASKNVEISQGHLELIRQMSLSAENLYKVGKAPQQDIIKALLEQTDLLNKLNSAERDLGTVKARLNTLLGRHPATTLALAEEPKLVSMFVKAEELERRALEWKPELRASEQDVRKADKAIELARRNQKYPDFMLGIQYWVAPDQRPKHMYTPMVSLTIPFSPWTKGKHDYEVEEALAEHQAAKSQHDAMKNAALFEVRELFLKARAAEKSLTFYKDGLLPQAEQSFGAAVSGYQTGQVNFMTLLEAQRTIRDTRLGYYRALVEYEQSVVDLEKAAGTTLPRRNSN
jgi:cobalt-zinc-cadmium efflux system outer membrane protein